MTRLLEEIKAWDKKPKELLLHLASLIKKDEKLLADFNQSLEEATDSQKGTCVEALEHVSQEKPKLAIPHLNNIVHCLKDNAPRVKWEAARIIGNIANKFPKEAAKAIEALLVNTKDKGTVVRWSAAFALGEILKSNKTARIKLLAKIKKIIQKEENNGVKNVYLRALKEV